MRFWQIIATSLDKASKNRFNNVDILIYSGKYCKKGRRACKSKKENPRGSVRTKHQHQIISRYYGNLENIMLQRLSELITELYLADKPTRKKQLWERVHRAMVKLKVKPAIIEHIMAKQSVEVLAKNLQDWHKAKK
ncbi:MAG: hypothetical protein ACYSYU_05840 [Planctomycetota bacterium]